MEQALGIDNLAAPEHVDWQHLLHHALLAHAVYQRTDCWRTFALRRKSGPTRDTSATRVRAWDGNCWLKNTAFWMDAGGRDTLNAHDGAELLHRVLWDLDIPHAYHLQRDADHVGPSIGPRLERTFAWVSAHLHPASASPQSAHRCADDPNLEAPSSEERALREALGAALHSAAKHDPSIQRHFGPM